MKYLLLCISVCLFSCGKENESAAFSSVKVNSCEKNMVAGSNITICLLKIEDDSRCPINAMCVHQGFATAKFSVKINQSFTDTLLLDLKGYESVNQSEVLINGYKIRFESLSPYPGEPDYGADNMKAGLVVER